MLFDSKLCRVGLWTLFMSKFENELCHWLFSSTQLFGTRGGCRTMERTLPTLSQRCIWSDMSKAQQEPALLSMDKRCVSGNPKQVARRQVPKRRGLGRLQYIDHSSKSGNHVVFFRCSRPWWARSNSRLHAKLQLSRNYWSCWVIWILRWNSLWNHRSTDQPLKAQRP